MSTPTETVDVETEERHEGVQGGVEAGAQPKLSVSARVPVPAKIAIMVLAVVALIALPLVLGDYRLLLANMMLINGIVVLGLVPLLGWSGQFAFISAAFMSIGAYTGGRLLNVVDGLPLEVGLVLGCLAGALIGLAFGALAVRVKGYYLAVVTVSFMFVVEMVAREGGEVTGGVDGFLISAPPVLVLGMNPLRGVSTYYIGLALTVIVLAFVMWLRRTSLARGWAALSVDEKFGQAVGVNPYRSRLIAFIIASAIIGLAGAWYAVVNQYVQPHTFGFGMMLTHFVFLIVGGVKSPIGAWVSAIVLTLASEYIRSFAGISEIVYGATLLLAVLLMRRGIAGVIEKITRTREKWA
ncbi:branched-chain amino acid ABC transporter permease [Tessaracoccus terricola]